MYVMRTEFRNRYFTPENWDAGHQQFINYLLGVLNLYEDELRSRFEEINHQQTTSEMSQPSISGNNEIVEAPVPSPIDSPISTVISKIQKERERRERAEREIWHAEIPNLIAKRNAEIFQRLTALKLIQAILNRALPDENITEAQTIDFLLYYLSLDRILNMQHIFTPQGGINKVRQKKTVWTVPQSPLTFQEFVNDEFLLNEIKSSPEPEKEMTNLVTDINKFSTLRDFPDMLETLFDVSSVNRRYDILRDVIDRDGGYIVFIPIIPNFKESNTGKTVMAFSIKRLVRAIGKL